MVANKLMSIGSIVISIGIGLIAFYVMSDLSKEKKKVLMEEMVTQLVHFFIFIWIGKIVLNFSTFIKSPLVILAYPSNSDAFYFAILCSAIVIVYKSKRGKVDVSSFMVAFIPVILMTSFLYEFIQLVWNHNTYALGNITLFTVLLVLYVLIRDHIPDRVAVIVMLIGWSAGSILLSFIQPFATVFGFIMAPWFVGLFFIVSLSLIIYHKLTSKSSE